MGAQESKATVNVDNAIRNSVKTIMEQKTDSSVNNACLNSASVKGVKNCQIEFAEQVCTAVAISNFTGSSDLSTDVAQDVMNNIMATTESLTSGMTIGYNSSESNTNVMNSVNMAMEATQSFMTDCTRNISAINQQSVEDCEDSVVRFAKQVVDTKVVGDCVVNSVGSLTAAQKLKNSLDASASAVTKGFDPFLVLMMILAIFLVGVIGVPMFAKGMKDAVFSPVTKLTPEERQANKRRMIALWIMFLLLVTMMGAWWPGYGSYKLGIFPWPYVGLIKDDQGNPPDCVEGKNMKRSTFINEFMWHDPLCLAPGTGACTAERQRQHYESCGIFATTNGCDDPLFIQERDKYFEVVSECSKLQGASYEYCSSAYIANKVFPIEEESFQGCYKCTEGELFGMWVSNEGVCSTSTVSKYDYMRVDEACDPADPHCKDTEEILRQTSPDDCMAAGYQKRKKKLSKHTAVCDRLEQIATVTTATKGTKPMLAEQCPPQADQYLTKCDSGAGTCDYTARSTNPMIIASCKNDLEGCCTVNEQGVKVCNDKQYEKDLDFYNHWNNICKERWEMHNALNPAAWIASLVLYIAIIGAMIVLLLRSPASLRQGMWSGVRSGFTGRDVLGRPVKNTTRNLIIAFVLLLVAVGMSQPFGLAGIANAGKPFPASVYTNEDMMANRSEWDNDSARLWGNIAGGISAALMFMLLGYMLFGRLRNTRGQLREVAAQDLAYGKRVSTGEDGADEGSRKRKKKKRWF